MKKLWMKIKRLIRGNMKASEFRQMTGSFCLLFLVLTCVAASKQLDLLVMGFGFLAAVFGAAGFLIGGKEE